MGQIKNIKLHIVTDIKVSLTNTQNWRSMVKMKGQEDVFDRQKKLTLSGIDHSKKGSFAKPIDDLMMYINAHEDYFTTSSCSGRIIVFSEGDEKKKGCRWLLTSHETVKADDVIETIQNEWCNDSNAGKVEETNRYNGERETPELMSDSSVSCSGAPAIPGSGEGQDSNITFKYESFILHLQSRTLEGAQEMLKVALGCGYRNSGLVVGKKKKFMVAVRSTHGLEVPLVFGSVAGVSDEYIRHLVALANDKLSENFVKVDKFFDQVKKNFPT